MKLSKRISDIKPSPTLAITAKANAMRAEGRDVIGFGAGEPDFDTPDSIKQAAIRAIEAGFTKYTPVGGTDELKDAIINKLERDSGLNYKREEVVVSCGAKHTLYNLAQVLFEEGDEVLIPSPYWVSYIDIIVLTGARPVVIETKTEDNFKLQPKQLAQAVSSRTRAILLNSPSNPVGVTYTKEELEKFAEVVAAKGIMVISDDIYEKIVYDGIAFYSLASISPEMKKLTVVVNGVSKSYAMTGWRIGYAAGQEEVIAAVTKLQSQNTSNPTSIAQKAAVEALRGKQDSVALMVEEFEKRRNRIVRDLNEIPGVVCLMPQGAFYVFPDFSAFYGRSFGGKIIADSSDLAAYFLDEANVAVVPGGEFGHDNHIRLSYATSMDKIIEGVARIRRALNNLA